MADCINNFRKAVDDDLFNTIAESPDPDKAALEQLHKKKKAKQQAALQAIRRHQVQQQAAKHSHGADYGLIATMTRDMFGDGTGDNIESRAKAILGMAHAKMAKMMSATRTKAAGIYQDKAMMRDIVRELFQKETGNADAARFASTISEVFEDLRTRFNRAGGDIKHRADYGAPTYHDPRRVKAMGPDAWKSFIRDRVDPAKMRGENGELGISPEGLNLALDKAYNSIVTEGLSDIRSGQVVGSKRANRHQDSRFFVFKDGDAWLEYHDKLGRADLYTLITDHIQGMAHDIALIEKFGPNPEATFRYMMDEVNKAAAFGNLKKKRLFRGETERKARAGSVEAVWNIVSGRAGFAQNTKFAEGSSTVRQWLVSTKLGAAFLSSISDNGFQIMTRRFNGLPVMRYFKQATQMINPANEEGRIAFHQMGFVADAWLNHTHAANRFAEITGTGVTAKLADFTIRASGLAASTDAGRKAFAWEFTAHLAKMADKSFDDLAAGDRSARAFREALERYDISAKDWDKVRATDVADFEGMRVIRPSDIMENSNLNRREAELLTSKVLQMINTEMDFAVPVTDALTRAITTGGGKRAGSAMGEAARHFFTFKSFPITVLQTHAMRMLYQTGGETSKAAYAAQLAILTTVFGAIALQAKELSKGREARPMDDRRFWIAAMMQGGGAGIAGDFLFSESTRFGNSFAATLTGPTVGLLEDIKNIPMANAWDAIKGKETRVMYDTSRLLRRNAPGPVSLWYTRLAFDRILFDNLDLMTGGTRARQSFKRQEKRWRREFGQDYYWKPGHNLPDVLE